MGVRATAIQDTGAGELVIEGVARDITKRHLAELQRRRLLTGIEHSAEAIVITDPEGRLEYVNPAYERSTGRSSQQVLGRAWAGLEVRQDPTLLAELSRVLKEQTTWAGRIKSLRAGGDSYYEDVTLSPFRDEDGVFAGIVALKRDVTDQLRLEAQLIQAQKMEAVGQLAGGIAHDFNNLLFIALGNIDLIRRTSPEPNLSLKLQDAQAALERAAGLVEQLLTFSRKGNVETTVLSLDSILMNSHGMLGRLLGEHIQLEFQYNAKCPSFLVGNASQIEQVIVNLCVNARDAMPDGGTLRVSLDEVPREQVPEFQGPAAARSLALVTVSDTGHGMSPDVLARVFEPFFTTKAPGKGSGLGLATAYGIVQQHRGHMHVESTPGAGSKFCIYLPLSDAEAPTPPSSRSPSTLVGNGRWVLVAEDEPAVRQLLAYYLEDVGFRVVAVDNGRAAIDALDSQGCDFDLVVLDAVMPELGGRAVLQALRERAVETPVLFVTGYDNASLAEVRDAPHVATLSKPFDPATLNRQVAKLLGVVSSRRTQAS
jgi:PAS domain S-box-containing protein